MRKSRLRFWRATVPLAMLAMTVWLIFGLAYPLSAESSLLMWLTRLDPLLLAAVWPVQGLPDWWWLPVLVIAVTVSFGRVFCGWICPVGGLLNTLSRLMPSGISKKHPMPKSVRSSLKQIRWYWLAAVMTLLAAGTNWPLLLTPFHLISQSLFELWQNRIPWLMIVPILLAILIFPRFWCVYVCPTGLVLAGLSPWRKRLAITNKCNKCQVCRHICPMDAADPAGKKITQDCILCLRCRDICPTAAVTWSCDSQVTGRTGIESQNAYYPSRRVVIKAALTAAGAYALSPALLSSAHAGLLRPPGALAGAQFALACSRCSRCMKACPSQCLQPVPLTGGFANYLSPVIIPRQARCELCMICQDVCPTGAITKISEDQAAIGTAILDNHSCIAWTEGKLCLVCREQCPRQAVEIDEHKRPSINVDLCVGCGACENSCPLDEAAVIVVNANRKA